MDIEKKNGDWLAYIQTTAPFQVVCYAGDDFAAACDVLLLYQRQGDNLLAIWEHQDHKGYFVVGSDPLPACDTRRWITHCLNNLDGGT